MLECVINVSEGRDPRVIRAIATAAERSLLDVHSDAHHNRSVLTLGSNDVEDAAFAVVRAAVELIDLRVHEGAHPRLGAADVVPFVPLERSRIGDALRARNWLAQRTWQELAVPCFLYGPERSLPEVRSSAFTTLVPDAGPSEPHPTAGASCVGARGLLVAYNLWVDATLSEAKRTAAEIRSPRLRALGLDVGGAVQVSCNLVDPEELGPGEAFDLVASRAQVVRAELVGLVPAAVLARAPRHRWRELDLDESRTIEARLEEARR